MYYQKDNKTEGALCNLSNYHCHIPIKIRLSIITSEFKYVPVVYDNYHHTLLHECTHMSEWPARYLYLVIEFPWDVQVALTTGYGFIKLAQNLQSITQISTGFCFPQLVSKCSENITKIYSNMDIYLNQTMLFVLDWRHCSNLKLTLQRLWNLHSMTGVI